MHVLDYSNFLLSLGAVMGLTFGLRNKNKYRPFNAYLNILILLFSFAKHTLLFIIFYVATL